MNDLVELFVENNNILLKMMRMHADECSSSLSLSGLATSVTGLALETSVTGKAFQVDAWVHVC